MAVTAGLTRSSATGLHLNPPGFSLSHKLVFDLLHVSLSSLLQLAHFDQPDGGRPDASVYLLVGSPHAPNSCLSRTAG